MLIIKQQGREIINDIENKLFLQIKVITIKNDTGNRVGDSLKLKRSILRFTE